MKRLLIIFMLSLFTCTLYSQQCIDMLILHMNDENNVNDTLFCKILSEDDENVIIDNGYAISTLSKKVIVTYQQCVREMTIAEIYRYEGINALNNDNFSQVNSPGAYLRKAARDTYISTCLAIVGAGSVTIGATLIDNQTVRSVTYIVGGVAVAASLFFVIKAWNEIYKAGKLMDINENSALYLRPNEDGIGLSLSF